MFKVIPVDKIKDDENVREIIDIEKIKNLAFSFLQHGVLQPIGVKEDKNGNEITYTLVFGRRRFMAAKLTNLKEIPAIILQDGVSTIRQLVENVQREALNPIDEAIAIKSILDSGEMTRSQLALSLGKSESQISNTLRLLKLPEEVIKMVVDKNSGITRGHAKVLMQIKDPEEQKLLAKKVVDEKVSVSKLSKHVPRIKIDSKEKASADLLEQLTKFKNLATSDRTAIPDSIIVKIRQEIDAIQKLISDKK